MGYPCNLMIGPFIIQTQTMLQHDEWSFHVLIETEHGSGTKLK